VDVSQNAGKRAAHRRRILTSIVQAAGVDKAEKGHPFTEDHLADAPVELPKRDKKPSEPPAAA
jgi:hypothetical protein